MPIGAWRALTRRCIPVAEVSYNGAPYNAIADLADLIDDGIHHLDDVQAALAMAKGACTTPSTHMQATARHSTPLPTTPIPLQPC